MSWVDSECGFDGIYAYLTSCILSYHSLITLYYKYFFFAFFFHWTVNF